MPSIGNSNSPTTCRGSADGFDRRPAARPSLRRWAATLPLIGIALATVAARAPGETPSAGPAGSVFAQAESRWSLSNARALLDVIDEATAEGLDPADYAADALRAAIEMGRTGPELEGLANASALKLAGDYANGRIGDRESLDWYIAPPTDPNRLTAELGEALDRDRLAAWLRGLLPDNAQYRALKAELAATSPTDGAQRATLRANLERWRWMPRSFESRYIYVNIPSYRLQLIDGGAEQASYNVVVGAPRTPTPQIAVFAQAIVANPSWILPPSVLKEGNWRGKGYRVMRRADGGLMVRQAPGPRNALGRVKIDMPNPLAIYLHDTPDKAVFDSADRTLSHGCIRVQNIEELVALLHDRGELDEALGSPRTTRVLQLEKSVPVYIVYFTAEADPDGSIRYLGDPYQRDLALLDRMSDPGRNAVGTAAP